MSRKFWRVRLSLLLLRDLERLRRLLLVLPLLWGLGLRSRPLQGARTLSHFGTNMQRYKSLLDSFKPLLSSFYSAVRKTQHYQLTATRHNPQFWFTSTNSCIAHLVQQLFLHRQTNNRAHKDENGILQLLHVHNSKQLDKANLSQPL